MRHEPPASLMKAVKVMVKVTGAIAA